METPKHSLEKAIVDVNEALARADVANDAFTHIFGDPEDNYPADTAERLAEYRMEEAEHLRDCQEDR